MRKDGSTPLAPSRPASGAGVTLALVLASLVCSFVWLLRGAHWDGLWNPALLAAALTLHGTMWWRGRRTADPASAARGAVPMRMAMALTAVTMAAVVLVPLHHSRDLYLYDIYGRAVAEHRVNPYTSTPEQLDDDAVDLVAEQWHDQPSMYGPAFVGLATVVSRLAGDGALGIRLVWQAITAGAALAAIALVARRTRDSMAVLALGCSPVLLAAVHDAHNDVLVGLGLLVTALMVERRRHAAAGLVAALVVATKLPAAVPVLAMGTWVAWRRRPVDAVRLLGPVLGIVSVGYLLVGGVAAITPLRESSGDDSRFAIWQPLRHSTFEGMLADGTAWRTTLDTVRDRMSTYSMLLLAACLLVVAWRYRRATRASEVATISLLVLMLCSTYVMPWYAAMVLPLAALAWRSRLSVVVQLQAAFVLLAYAHGPGNEPPTDLGRWLEQHAVWINVALLVLALFWARPTGVRARDAASVPVQLASTPSRRHDRVRAP